MNKAIVTLLEYSVNTKYRYTHHNYKNQEQTKRTEPCKLQNSILISSVLNETSPQHLFNNKALFDQQHILPLHM